METPVYLFTGLLESGKTTLIHEVAGEEDFLEPGTTVLVQCEEGEEEFGSEFLERFSIVLVKAENPQDLNELFWKRIEKEYAPAQIMIEYNGMWEIEKLFDSDMPEDWFVGGIYSTVNNETAELYVSNMRKTFMEPLKASNLIIFNRCDDNTDRKKFRRSLKALNPEVQVVYERKDGTLFDNEVDVMPFDYSGQIVEFDDMDYGLWYLDAIENPKHYIGKEIEFTAKYCASATPGQPYFVPGRHVMTCCEDDIQFLGFICEFEDESYARFKHGDWVNVKVRFDYGQHDIYGDGEEGPILQLIYMEPAEKPEPELVTFM